MELESVEFDRPALAYAALPLALLIHLILVRLWRRLGPAAWALNPLARWARVRGEPRSLLLDVARILLLTLFFIAVAGPYVIVVEKRNITTVEEARLNVEPRPGLMIMLDISGSMAGLKLIDAKNAVASMIQSLDPRIDIGLIAFNNNIVAMVPPTSDRTRITSVLANLTATGGTMYTYPMTSAFSLLKIYRQHGLPAYLVIVSDGIPADARDAIIEAETYALEGIKIYAVLIGDDDTGLETLKSIANPTGGTVYYVDDSGKLAEVLETIAGQVNQEINISLEIELAVEVERKEPVTHIIAYTTIGITSLASIIRYQLTRAEP